MPPVLDITLEELACRAAQEMLAQKGGLVLEGSAAVALVPLLEGAAGMTEEATDVVAVLTGRNVDPDRLAAVL